ncbi:hypothetical protein X975_09740, partial [Stegodyphus mimosarum]
MGFQMQVPVYLSQITQSQKNLIEWLFQGLWTVMWLVLS